MTLNLSDDVAREVERAARDHGLSRAQYLAQIVTYHQGHDAGWGDLLDLRRRVRRIEERLGIR